jgi:hypothetical protein
MQLRIWIITILLAAGLAACAPENVPTPQPTPKTELAEPIPVTVERVEPTLTATPILTNTPIPTSTPIPVPPTETPTTDTTPIAEASTPLPELVWAENIANIASINSFFLNWSPVENEFVYNDCLQRSEQNTSPDDFVFLVTLPKFEKISITPEGFSCFGIISLIWSPSGQEIFFTGVQNSQAMFPYDESGNVELWRMNKTGMDVTFTHTKGWYLNFEGLLTEKTILYSVYSGGGARYLMLYDLETNQDVASTWLYNPNVKGINSDFAVIEYGNPEFLNSVAIFSPKTLHEERDKFDDLGPNLYDLSFDGTVDNATPNFFSSYADWLPNKNQILVETWDKEVNILELDILHENVIDLQLWDIESNTLELIAQGAFLGDFSPIETHLSYISSNESGPEIKLLIRDTGEILFSLPVYLEKTSSEILVSFTSFSPNGRFFTFFTPETDLMVYDIQIGEMLPPITAVPAEPLWSPDSTRFVYTDPVFGLSIYDTRSHTTYPLAESGGERLSNPQWSFDGAYLSVAYTTEDYGWETAVLSLP